MSSGSLNNEIQDMRNSMKMNFVNHQKSSQKNNIPHTFDLHTQIKDENRIKDPAPLVFKRKDKTLQWDKVAKTVPTSSNIDELAPLVKNLTYAHLEEDDIKRFNCPRSVKAFKLMQLCIEYMNHTQSYMEDVLSDREAEYYCIQRGIQKLTKKCKENKEQINTDKIRKKKYALKDYELMFKDLGFLDDEFDSLRFQCDICQKKGGNGVTRFRSLYHLEKHYEKVHPKLTLKVEDYTVVKVGEDDEEVSSLTETPFEKKKSINEELKEPKQSKRYVDQKQRTSKSNKELEKLNYDYNKSISKQRSNTQEINKLLSNRNSMKPEKYIPESEPIKEEDVDQLKTYFDNKFDEFESTLNKTVKENYNKIRDESKKKTSARSKHKS